MENTIPNSGHRDASLMDSSAVCFYYKLSEQEGEFFAELLHEISLVRHANDLENAARRICDHIGVEELSLLSIGMDGDLQLLFNVTTKSVAATLELACDLKAQNLRSRLLDFCDGVARANTQLPFKILANNSEESGSDQFHAFLRYPAEESTVVLIVSLSTVSVKTWNDSKKALCHLALSALWHQHKKIIDKLAARNKIAEFKSILDCSELTYSYWLPETGWIFDRKKFLESLGYFDVEPEFNSFYEEDMKVYKKNFLNLLETGEKFKEELRAMHKDGSTRMYQLDVMPLRTQSTKKIDGAYRVTKDITENWQAREQILAMMRTDQWLNDLITRLFNQSDRAAINQALQSISEYFDTTRSYLVTYQSPSKVWKAIDEYLAPGELPIHEIHNPSTLLQLKKATREQIEKYCLILYNDLDKEPEGLIRDALLKTGAKSVLLVAVILDEEFVGHMGITSPKPRTWTEQEIRILSICAESAYRVYIRLQILEDARIADQRFHLAMEVSSSGIWERDYEKDTLYVSPDFFQMMGYQWEEISFNDTSKFVIDMIVEEDRSVVVQKIADFENSPGQSELFWEARYYNRDGSISWISSLGKVFERDENNKPIRLLGVLTDVTVLKNYQQQLEEIRGRAVTANISKGEFLARMSHEIRTPMNAIIGMSYLIQRTDLTTEQRNYINDVESAATALLGIIDDILDFSKIESGTLSIVNQPFNLHRELQRLVKLISLKVVEKGVVVNLHIDKSVPETLIGDKTRVAQIVTNLLGNAVKFTNEGSISLNVEIPSQTPPNQSLLVRFMVCDTGIGMGQEQRENLFKPFVQADRSTARHFGGTGLGLSIAKNLVELMGGKIEVQSEENKGTTFTFTIMFRESKTEKIENDPIEAFSGSTSNELPKLEKCRVLLAEDNVVNQKVAQGILNGFGVDVTVVNNGREAIDTLKVTKDGYFDAILMDIEMPELDGLETTGLIRSQATSFQNLPIIAMTAHAMTGDKEKCLQAGMNAHISKPIHPDTLYQTLLYEINRNSQH